MTLLLPLLAFVFITLLIAAGAMALSPGGAAVIERRLGEITGRRVAPVSDHAVYERTVEALKRIGGALPKSPSEMGKLQLRLVHAGFRRGDAVAIFLGVRVGLALLCFAAVATPILMRPNVLLALGAAGLGYVLPGVALARLAKRRQHRIRLSLPDALDLLVVCVEAGLGLDQAFSRVSEELRIAHPDLSDELRLVNLEMRVGKSRTDAMRELAERTGVDDIKALVAMLIQTERFGTSIARSLRVHSDDLRVKRRQRAEEMAAKTPVKMVPVLVFFIFPALFVVVLGPAFINVVRQLLPMLGK